MTDLTTDLAAIAGYLDRLGFPAEPSPELDEVLAWIAAHSGAPADPRVAALYARSLHGHNAQNPQAPGLSNLYFYDGLPMIGDGLADSPDRDVARLAPFASNNGGVVLAIDPRGRFGHGATAVYAVDQGAAFVEYVELVAPDVVEFLRRYAEAAPIALRKAVELRDAAPPAGQPLVLGDGTVLPADAVFDPRYHLADDVLRSVRLRRPLAIGRYRFRPGDGSVPDLEFHASGAIKAGVVDDVTVEDYTLVPGTRATWMEDGWLEAFTPAHAIVLRDVRCRAGEPVLCTAYALWCTPDEDVTLVGGTVLAAGVRTHVDCFWRPVTDSP